MDRYEMFIKKVIEGKKKIIYNFLVIEFILITISIYFFSNDVDSRYFSIACTFLLIATLIFIGFRILNNDLSYCYEYYKVDKIQVIRKLKMNNPLVQFALLTCDHHHLRLLLKKAHEAILFVNKYKERVDIGPWIIETDFEKNKNLKNEDDCKQILDSQYHVNYYKLTAKLDSNLKDIFNKLGVNINYPTEILYEDNENKRTYDITYKVYGFIVNYTTFYLDEESYQKLDINDNISILIDDSNLDSIKYDVDPYFEVKVKLSNV
ncbi:MAG: hypothetical protein K0Q49_1973 [Haloplasmataceae bacterium]|jgi:hypothetical protein|nr:hypothetical protein [Haloplasmataceae bacterium]